MDPIYGSISSVFGLLATFFQERQRSHDAQQQATIQEYIEWLRRRDHAQAVTLLQSNRDLMIAVRGLLDTNHEELLGRFDHLEHMLALVLGSSAEWGELARSLDPNAGLSEQAVEILRWFDASGGSKVIQINTRDGAILISDGKGENYTPIDPRFMEDDMNTLVGLGLLNLGYNSQGSPTYTITRSAVDLVKRLAS